MTTVDDVNGGAPALETVDVQCVFRVNQGFLRGSKPLHAVNGVSLRIPRGQVLGLVGESGCGKTTLAQILLGLQNQRPGCPLQRRERVEFLAARHFTTDSTDIPRSLFVAEPHEIHPLYRVATAANSQSGRSAELGRRSHEDVGSCWFTSARCEQLSGALSGGQRQRVAVARALIMRPEVVICDEPTSALDVSVQSQILNLLQELKDELGLTYLLISHNLAVVEHMADRVAVMYLGRIVEEADTETLFASPRHPYTRALLASVLTPDPSLGVPNAQLGTVFPNPIAPPSGCTFHPRCVECMDRCKTDVPRTVSVGPTSVECLLYDDKGRAAA